jgi:glycosyltransferase involved in cell wall biosynthesis
MGWQPALPSNRWLGSAGHDGEGEAQAAQPINNGRQARPALASRIGGIQDQIRHGTSGLLLEDPSDLVGFGRGIQTLLSDRDRAQRLGEQAHRRVGQEYLAPRRLTQELDLIDRVAGRASLRRGARGRV